MKVQVTLTVEVDEKAWARDYGLAAGQVRQDVKDAVVHLVQGQLGQLGLLKENGAEVVLGGVT